MSGSYLLRKLNQIIDNAPKKKKKAPGLGGVLADTIEHLKRK